MDIEKKVAEAPRSPGVYIMRNVKAEVIYVGKAVDLRSRLASYFLHSGEKDAKTAVLVSRVAGFDIIATDNEAEALILECNLIKKYRPKYNILLKDDKRFPSLRLDTATGPFPRLEIVRKVRKGDKAEIFGPFTRVRIWHFLRMINRVFMLRDCSDAEFRNRARPCIRHEIGHCLGPCKGLCTEERYSEALALARMFLKGEKAHILEILEKDMTVKAAGEFFEEAARLRDNIREIGEFEFKQNVQMKDGDIDVIAVVLKDRVIRGTVLRIRDGKVDETEQLRFASTDEGIDWDPESGSRDALAALLGQYYLVDGAKAAPAARILLPFEPSGLPQLKEVFRLRFPTIRIVLPSSDQENELVQLAKKNTLVLLDDQLLSSVAYELGLDNIPRRIECYDTSHLFGSDHVAARVVFIDGGPSKEDYRHYHPRQAAPGDDFGMLREVFERRFRADTDSFPDLVVVDGGKGQLAQAVSVLKELGILNVEVVSLAKARSGGKGERVFKPGRKNPIVLKEHTRVFKLLCQIRDEAHRFAITFHRSTRDKRAMSAATGAADDDAGE